MSPKQDIYLSSHRPGLNTVQCDVHSQSLIVPLDLVYSLGDGRRYYCMKRSMAKLGISLDRSVKPSAAQAPRCFYLRQSRKLHEY